MRKFSNSTRTIAMAGVFGLAAVLAGASSASARTYTRCDADGDNCVRVHCDWDGDNCWREPIYSSRDYYRDYDNGYYGGSERHWVCDADGDNCHWAYYRF